jgi:proline iminopeptidase
VSGQEEDGLFLAPEPFKTDYLKVSALHRIFYVCCGNRSGKPVLCLHGGPGVGSYPRMAQYFNPEKYLIVLHDQRGAGRSTPHGELKENTTWDLVEDIEKLRVHLGLGKVLIFGGSWGTTLGLAYAQTHPEQVTGMILRGVFLGTEEEIEYHYLGNRFFFPREHDKLLSLLPDPARGTHPDYLFELIRGDDPVLRQKILRALAGYELKFMKLNMPDERVSGYLDNVPQDEGLRMASIDLHYVTHRYFMKEGHLLENMEKIAHIPAVLINGRYDMAAPPLSAYRVHKAMPKSKLIIVEKAGHSESEVGITAELVKATAEFE